MSTNYEDLLQGLAKIAEKRERLVEVPWPVIHERISRAIIVIQELMDQAKSNGP